MGLIKKKTTITTNETMKENKFDLNYSLDLDKFFIRSVHVSCKKKKL